MFPREHQTKILAMTPAGGSTYMAVVDVGRVRFETSRAAALGAIDVVGVQEDFTVTPAALQERFGWAPPSRE